MASILRSISRLSDVGKATLEELMNNGSDNVWKEYEKQWNRIVPQRDNGEND